MTTFNENPNQNPCMGCGRLGFNLRGRRICEICHNERSIFYKKDRDKKAEDAKIRRLERYNNYWIQNGKDPTKREDHLKDYQVRYRLRKQALNMQINLSRFIDAVEKTEKQVEPKKHEDNDR